MKSVIAVSSEELARILYEYRRRKPEIDFYGNFNPINGESEWAYRIAVQYFADSCVVIANYYGGGSLFCYEITDETELFDLSEQLKSYFHKIGVGDEVFIEPMIGPNALRIGKVNR